MPLNCLHVDLFVLIQVPFCYMKNNLLTVCPVIIVETVTLIVLLFNESDMFSNDHLGKSKLKHASSILRWFQTPWKKLTWLV